MVREKLERIIESRVAARPKEVGTCCHDLRQGITTWSPTMYEMLGLPVGDGHPPAGFGMALYSRESQVRLEAALAEAMKHDGGRVALDLAIRHADGYCINVHVAGVVTYEDGAPAWVDATMAERIFRKAARGGG